MPLSSGARIGRYEILSPLGAGDIGEVCRAKETKLGPETAPPSVLVGGTPGLVLRSVIRVTVCCVLASAALLPTMSAQQTSKPLDIYVVDVDGGESTLFVSPSGESM